jgi:hypothetical protein
MLDLSSLKEEASAIEDGVEVKITHPVTGEETGMIVTVASYESSAVRSVQRRIANSAMKKRKKGMPTAEDAEEGTYAIAAAAVLGWSGVTEDGEPLEFTKSNVIKVLKAWPFIAEQIDEVADDRANFFKT